MSALTIALFRRAVAIAADVRPALKPSDHVIEWSDTAEADILVVPAEIDEASFASSYEHPGIVVALGDPTRALFDARFDAFWPEPLDLADVTAVVETARLANPRKGTRALEAIATEFRARAAALLAQLTRDEDALRALHEPPTLATDTPFIEITDEPAFARAMRHAERRATHEKTRTLLLLFEASEFGRLPALKSHDVVLRRGLRGLALLTDASEAVIADAGAALGERVAVLPGAESAVARVFELYGAGERSPAEPPSLPR